MSLERFDLYGALWIVCSRYHSGAGSRGYRILSRLTRAGYSPSLTLERGSFESSNQRSIARALLAYRREL